MAITIGTCPAAWGISFADDPRQTPWSRCLDEMVEVGYQWTELGPYGYLPTDQAVLERELQQRNLKLTGGVAMPHLEDDWADIEKHVVEVGEYLGALGAPFLVLIDDMYRDQRTGKAARVEALDDDGWKRLIDATHATARLASEKFGLQTVFHPHCETHVEYEEQIERLLDDTDPSLVGLCMDTGHHAYRRGDPLAFIGKHHSRLQYVHMKNVDPARLQQVVYDEGASLAEANVRDVWCEPDRGAVDFAALRELLIEVGYDGFVIVEQDMFPTQFDKPLGIATRSMAYFRSIAMA